MINLIPVKLKRMLYPIIIILCLSTLAGCAMDTDGGSSESPSSGDKTGAELPRSADLISTQVERIVDGDTICVNYNGVSEKVRLIGVDTPETVHPTIGEEAYGHEASDYTMARLSNQIIELELDVQERDQYGRLLAYIWIGSELFNETLVREGYAQVSTYPPNIKYVDRFTAAQTAARDAGRGLWGIEQSTSTPIDPGQDKQLVKNSSPPGSFKYLGSIKSNKYHYPTCKYVETINPENLIGFHSKAEAEAAGYYPCTYCDP